MVSKSDKTIPNLENATPSFLMEELEKMRIQTARFKFLDGIYKEALKARITKPQQEGTEPIEGEKHQGKYKWVSSERIDADAVKEELKNEPERLKRCVKTGGYWQLDIVNKESPSI